MPRKKKVTEKPVTLSLRDVKAVNDRQMLPADNVDADGTAWSTVGENIRKGKNGSGSSGGGGGGDSTITKETIANFYNALTGGDWRVADARVNSWNHNAEDDWDLKVQKWQKEDAEALQNAAVSEEHTEV